MHGDSCILIAEFGCIAIHQAIPRAPRVLVEKLHTAPWLAHPGRGLPPAQVLYASTRDDGPDGRKAKFPGHFLDFLDFLEGFLSLLLLL